KGFRASLPPQNAKKSQRPFTEFLMVKPFCSFAFLLELLRFFAVCWLFLRFFAASSLKAYTFCVQRAPFRGKILLNCGLYPSKSAYLSIFEWPSVCSTASHD